MIQSVLPVCFTTFLIFAFFEILCSQFDMDFHHFELISQDDVNQKMQNLMSLYRDDYDDLDTSTEIERPEAEDN